MLVEQHSQVLSVGGADVEQQRGTLIGPEAQGDVLCSQGHGGGDGGGHAAAPAWPGRRLLLEGVGDGGPRLEAG